MVNGFILKMFVKVFFYYLYFTTLWLQKSWWIKEIADQVSSFKLHFQKHILIKYEGTKNKLQTNKPVSNSERSNIIFVFVHIYGKFLHIAGYVVWGIEHQKHLNLYVLYSVYCIV